ncbi:hypothetical protein M0R45_009663 [Rubus argutus]|uniref:Uncharacterized protein n=1 Tax=Rubus argutus TaxID=59490 RepID=A0AAW1Y527_RUBAR
MAEAAALWSGSLQVGNLGGRNGEAGAVAALNGGEGGLARQRRRDVGRQERETARERELAAEQNRARAWTRTATS